MKDKSKKIIMIMIMVLIIIIIGVLIMINKDYESDAIEYDGEIVVNNAFEKVSIRSNYYIIKNIVEKYYLSLCNLNKTTDDVKIYEYEGDIKEIEKEIAKQLASEIENTKTRICNFFGEDYIQESDISIDNLKDKLGDYDDLFVLIKEMYVRDLSGFLKMYFVFGTITEKDTLKTEDFELMILIDEKNKTFNLYPSDYIEEKNLYELSKNKDFNLDITEIENRKYNKYKYETINDETYVSDLLDTYTQTIKYIGIDYSYDKLDEEYKEKRFKEKSIYEAYIEDKKKEISSSLLEYYKVNKNGGNTQYICRDNHENYYIFKENSIMDYSLILDTYTLDLPEFTEKYKTATIQEKVGMNIEKIVEALNGKDYNYVYSKLADEFKANYFKTYNDFETYAKNTFDIGNEVTYDKYTEAEDLCTYKIILKGKNKTITKTIVMRLEEGTEFIMSFNVE